MTDSSRPAANGRNRSWIVKGFVLSCFFPYPALASVGGAVGLTMTILAVGALLLWCPEINARRPLMSAWALVFAASLSAVANMQTNSPTGTSSLNALLAFALAVVPLAAMSFIPKSVKWADLIVPTSLAVMIHAAVGFYQWQQFQSNVFPLGWIYNNPSFADIESVGADYALYVKRPFGLFPEPSALAAGIGPFLLLLAKSLPGVRGLSRLFAAAALISGSMLMLATESVYLILWVPLLAITLIGTLATVRNEGARLVILLICSVGIWLVAARALSIDRLALSNNLSTQYRLQSIFDGLNLWVNDLRYFVIGSGPGSVADRLQSSGSTVNTVHSLVVTHLVEWGLLAGVIWTLVLFSTWRRGQRAIVLGWFASVLLVTSYSGLAVLWLMLGILLREEEDEDPARGDDAPFRRGRAHAGRRSTG